MEYWTVLWIAIIGGPLDGHLSHIVYPTEQACDAARIEVGDTLGYDYKLTCAVSDTPSSSIRPRANPRVDE